MSELRAKINGFPEDGDDTERDSMTSTYGKLDSRYRAALVLEQIDEKPSGNDQTPEGRDLKRLLGRVSIEDYVREAITGNAAEGAAKELREATVGAMNGGGCRLTFWSTALMP